MKILDWIIVVAGMLFGGIFVRFGLAEARQSSYLLGFIGVAIFLIVIVYLVGELVKARKK